MRRFELHRDEDVSGVSGIPRPVPPAPSQRDPELAAALNEQRRQSYNAETLRTRPAPRSDTPSDERACVSCNGTGRTPSPTGMAQIGGMSCAGCFGTGKKENPIVLSNECSDPDPNGGAPCCRPLGHHVLTDHWNGQDEWPAQPAPSSDTLADERGDFATTSAGRKTHQVSWNPTAPGSDTPSDGPPTAAEEADLAESIASDPDMQELPSWDAYPAPSPTTQR